MAEDVDATSGTLNPSNRDWIAVRYFVSAADDGTRSEFSLWYHETGVAMPTVSEHSHDGVHWFLVPEDIMDGPLDWPHMPFD